MAIVVTAVVPFSGRTTGGRALTTILGSGFVATPGVTFGGTAATSVVFVSATKLTCTTPAHAAGLVNVVVTNPDTTTGTLTNGFKYHTPVASDTTLVNLVGGVALDIERGSANISRGRSQETLRFTMSSGSAPTQYNEVLFGLGSCAADDLIFYGEVQTISQKLRDDNTYYEVACVDTRFQFDKRQVFGSYTGAAGTVAQSVLTTYTSRFTGVGIQSGLPSINVTFTGEYVSAAMDKICQLIGASGTQAYWYLDNSRDLHLFTTETTTEPDTIDSNNKTLVLGTFAYEKTTRQVRNRVRVVGYGTSSTFAVPSGITDVAVSDVTGFPTSGSLFVPLAPTQTMTYSSKLTPQATKCIAQFAGGSSLLAGTTQFDVANFGSLPSGGGWATVGGQTFHFTGVSSGGGGMTFTGIPSTGTGSIGADLQINDQVVLLPTLQGLSVSQVLNAGIAISVTVVRNNATSQTALSTKETENGNNSDGIHEYTVTDTTLSTTTDLNNRGDAELTKYAPETRNSCTYQSLDPKSRPRRLCTITSYKGITDSLYIQQVSVSSIDVADGAQPIFSVTASNDDVTIEQFIKKSLGLNVV